MSTIVLFAKAAKRSGPAPLSGKPEEVVLSTKPLMDITIKKLNGGKA